MSIERGRSVSPGYAHPVNVDHTQRIIAEAELDGVTRETFVEVIDGTCAVGDVIPLKRIGDDFVPLEGGVAVNKVFTILFQLTALAGVALFLFYLLR